MYFLIIQLFKTQYKDDLFLAITSAGVEKVTYCDGQNFEDEIQRKIPLFADLFGGWAQRGP